MEYDRSSEAGEEYLYEVDVGETADALSVSSKSTYRNVESTLGNCGPCAALLSSGAPVSTYDEAVVYYETPWMDVDATSETSSTPA